MSHLLLRSFLVGPASSRPQLAAQLLSDESNTSHLRVALTGLSHLIKNEPPFSEVQSSFESGFMAFQTALDKKSPSRKLAQGIVQRKLAPIISGLSDQAWRSMLRRFSSLEDVKSDLGDTLQNVWMPRIVVEGKEKRRIAEVEALMTQTLRGMLSLSVYNNYSPREWNETLFKSGLIEASEVKVEVEILKPGEDEVLIQVSWNRMKDGSPVIRFACHPKVELTRELFATAVMRGLRLKPLSNYFKIRGKDLAQEDSTPLKQDISFFKDLFHGNLLPEGANAVLTKVQRKLILRNEFVELKNAFGLVKISQKMRDFLISQLDSLQLRLRVHSVEDEGKNIEGVTTSFRKGYIYMNDSDARKDDTLFVDFKLSNLVRDTLTENEVWIVLARAFSMWVWRGKEEGSSKIDFHMKDSSALEPTPTLCISPTLPPLSTHPDVSNRKVAEYHKIINWLSAIDEESVGKFSGLKELKPFFQEIGLAGFRYKLILLEWINKELERWNDVFMKRIGEGFYSWEMLVFRDFKDLLSISPFQMLELFNMIMNDCTSGAHRTRGPQNFKVKFNRNVTTVNRGEKVPWTWLRLLWSYENFPDSSSAQNKIQILGDRAQELGLPMGRALKRVLYSLMSSGEMKNFNRMTFAVDYVDAKNQLAGVWELRKADANNVSILSGAKGKLIHFDGYPNLDDKTWDRVMRLALRAPEGYSWMRLGKVLLTNRPELIAETGNEEWYMLSAGYKGAQPDIRSQYRLALDLVREVSVAAGFDSPTPQSTHDEIRSLYRSLAKVYHPDRRGTDKDVDGLFNSLQEAFNIMEKLHPKVG
ncbi:MAG: DnaJ domain-containing protein [Pseudomonadota bacterium]